MVEAKKKIKEKMTKQNQIKSTKHSGMMEQNRSAEAKS